MESTRTRPAAVFMAFGTKGDVYPIAAVAAAFACDQQHYDVVFVTHSAHEDLRMHLHGRKVAYAPVSSPPVLSPPDDHGSANNSFSVRKKEVIKEHRQECVSIVERIFGDDSIVEGDLIVINFFALEGWSLAELFQVRCVVAAPYVVPYSAPSSFERQFTKEHPELYRYFKDAPSDKVCWKDVIHWMWPLFSEEWGSWRSLELKLSALPLTDPVTGLPTWHDRPPSPLLLYGFSGKIVECPGYWPPNVRVCGFWFLPEEWQFSCNKCTEISALVSSGCLNMGHTLCSMHTKLQDFIDAPGAPLPLFISLSSVGSMGFMKNLSSFIQVLGIVSDISNQRFILFTAGYGPLDAAIRNFARDLFPAPDDSQLSEDGIILFSGRLFCFSGMIPYKWLFSRCAAAIHHGGSGSTAAALHAGIPQILCPFLHDQFYWAERMSWLGVASEPLKRKHLLPDTEDSVCLTDAANALVRAIAYALSPDVKSRALELSKRISSEDGISAAVQILKEETSRPTLAED